MKKKIGIAIGITVLVIIIIAGTVYGINYSIKKTKENQANTVKTFFSYIDEKNYEKMYEMISSASKENISKEDFIKRNQNIYEGIGASEFQIDIIELFEENDQNKVKYNEKFFTEAGEVSFENTVTLEKEDEYKLNWSSKLIFPELEENYKVRIATVKSRRGSIIANNDQGVLAYDGEISSVGIVPGKLQNKEESISKISQILEVSVENINKALNESYVKEDTFVPIKKIAKDSELKEQLLLIPGIMISGVDGRVYPLGEEAAHLVGYVQPINAEELKKHEGEGYTTTSLIGKSGLEYTYEETLRGIDGTEIYIENDTGSKLKEIVRQEQKDGKDLIITIDAKLQKAFYDEMKNDKGLFVVMNAETGEIRALVSTPSFDSNDFVLGMTTENWNNLNSDEAKPLYNRFKQSYCPGSTFKPITAAIGLTEGIINENSTYDYTGTAWQKSSGWGEYFVTTLTKYSAPKNVVNALNYSDNIFFAQLALDIGAERFSKKLDELKFNSELDFEIMIKSSQYLNKDGKFTEGKLANTGYGQGDLLVNPIHMASIYSAFANKGAMVKPRLTPFSGMVETYGNVFSEEATEIVKNAMLNLVESSNGTSHDAKINGITMIGKTGTAELKKSKDDNESGTLGWFNCVTLDRPNENLVIIGMVENTQNNTEGGSHYVISKIKKVLQEY